MTLLCLPPQKSQLCEIDDRSLELLQGGDGHMWKGFYSRENIQAALRHTYLPTELVEVSADLHTFVLVYRHGFTHLNGCYCVFKKSPKIKLISYAWGKCSFQKKLPMHLVMNNQWVSYLKKKLPPQCCSVTLHLRCVSVASYLRL